MAGIADQVPLGPAGIELQSSPNVGNYEAPTDNPAIQLAESLREASPKAGDFVDQLGAQLRAKDQAAAHTAAMQSSAAGYKDAVASGSIPGAHSPWFIQQFNQDRAEINFKDQSASTIAASQSWAERSYQDGGVAYQDRLTKAIGALRQSVFATPGMHPIDAEVGYQKGAQPLLDQAIAENDRYQTQSIGAQKVQDSTSLIESGIQDYYKAHPTAKPEEVLASLEPQFQKMESIGFQKSDIAEMAFNATLGASYNSMDGSILHDISNVNFRGGTPLSLIAGKDGKPYGEQIGYADYRIEMEARAASLQETKAHTTQVEQEGNAAMSLVQQHFGWSLLDGSTTPSQLMDFMKGQGVSPEGAMAASRQLNSQFEGIVGINKSLVAVNETNPAIMQNFMGVAQKVAQSGLTPALTAQINQMVALGQISPDKANHMFDQGVSRNNTLLSEGRADARTQEELHSEATREHHQEVQDAFNTGNKVRENNEADVAALLLSKGDQGVAKNPQVEAEMKRRGDFAYRSYLAQHPAPPGTPEDYQGAGQAQRTALAQWAATRLSRLHPAATQGLAKGPTQ